MEWRMRLCTLGTVEGKSSEFRVSYVYGRGLGFSRVACYPHMVVASTSTSLSTFVVKTKKRNDKHTPASCHLRCVLRDLGPLQPEASDC